MSINLKARETMQNIGTYKGSYRYVLQTELYSALNKNKVFKEAAIRSGIAEGTIQAAWAAIGEVIKAWATEGHSVPIPGVGSMRFSVRATSVENVTDVSTSLITSRRVIFTPSTDIKNELKNTSIKITCYDKNGKIAKEVSSSDNGTIEEEEDNGIQSGGDNEEEENPFG